MATEIRVGPKHVAIVDDSDAERVQGYSWYAHNSGRGVGIYARADIKVGDGRVRLWMHRLILDARPGQFSDHLNGNGLDNRRENLRLCTREENARNSRKHKQSERSPYKGVYAYNGGGRWLAVIKDPTAGRQVMIGVFDDPVSAARAYDAEARRLFGEFAQPNFPEGSTGED